MSTHSSIAVMYSDGRVEAVYCHFDGYLSGVGHELLASHDNFVAATILVACGDIDSFQNNNVKRLEGADAGNPLKYKNLNDYLACVENDTCGEYHYIYMECTWHAWGRAVDRISPNIVKLTHVLTESAKG